MLQLGNKARPLSGQDAPQEIPVQLCLFHQVSRYKYPALCVLLALGQCCSRRELWKALYLYLSAGVGRHMGSFPRHDLLKKFHVDGVDFWEHHPA